MENLDDILFPETAHDSKIISLERHSETANFKPGDFIDHYQIISELGQGGMGIVYKAMDTFLNRIVALKIMLILNQSDQIALKRFQREAEICATLKHPYIVSVYTIGEYKSFPYIVMEYIEGIPINQYVQQNGENDWNLCATIIYKVAQALEYVHSNHIIHRDIKPSNILVRPNGDPVLMDFGIGKILYNQNKHNTLTKEGEILGTLFYSSPEQTRGQAVSEKTDIYSIGVILYQLLTKQCPFYAENTYILLRQISTIIPTPPCMINKSIPEKLQEVSLRCMEKNPSLRYTIKELLTILHDFLKTPNKVTISQTYKKVIWLRYYKASIFTALFILLICATTPVALYICSNLLKLELYKNDEIKHTIQLYTIKLDDLWKENSEKLICTLFKEFGNMYKEKLEYEKAKKYYNFFSDKDYNSLYGIIETFKLQARNKQDDQPLKDALDIIKKRINREDWNKELYRQAGNLCIELTQYYFYKIAREREHPKSFNFQEIKEKLYSYKKEAQNYLEKYLKKSPSEKTSIYAQLSELEIYNDNTTILENISNIEQKIKITEHSKETYWYYNNHFENICKKILEEEKKYKNNFNQEYFDQYLTHYLYLCKNIESEKSQKDWGKILRPFLYCAEIRPILEKRISILNDKINELSNETKQLNNKEEISQKIKNLKHQILKYQFLLKEQELLKIQCLLANFYMTQDEQSTLSKIYQDEKIYNTLMTISLSKIKEPFFRFLSIFALVALPDKNAHELIEKIVSFYDNDIEQLSNTYNLVKEEIDLEQAKLWTLILDEHLDKRQDNFTKLLTKLSDEKKLSDEILLILFTHIDQKLLTIINNNDKFYNLTYDDLLKKNNLEILLIKIQQDDIYNFQYINDHFENLEKVIKKILNKTDDIYNSNQNIKKYNQDYQFFCLQFLKIYYEQLYQEYTKELENNGNTERYKKIGKLLSNLQEYTKEIYSIFKDTIKDYAKGNNGLPLQVIALFMLRKSNTKDYENIIYNDIIDKAKKNNQSLHEYIQVDIASYWVETGKIEKIIEFYNDFDISSNVLIDMLARWHTKIARNNNSSKDIELLKFLRNLLQKPSKIKNKELRTTLLYLFAYYPLDLPLLPLDKWRKNWLDLNKSDIYTSLGTIFSASKYPNNPIFNKKRIIFSKKNTEQSHEEQLITIAKECIQGKRNYREETLQSIAYSLIMMKAYYYIYEVKNEDILRKNLKELPDEIMNNILDKESKTKITEQLKKSLYYGFALGYSNLLYNDFKYCWFEDFEFYRNFYDYNKDPLKHHRNHFFNKFLSWSSNLYTERLYIIVSELQKRADIETRNTIFERENIKNEALENKAKKEHKKKAIDVEVNKLLRLQYNLKDYVQCLKQSIHCYKEAIKNEPRQELNDVIESILNNNFLLQRKLELGIIQSITAGKMRASNKDNREILKESRQNIKEVQDIVKHYIFKQYQQLKDTNVKQKILSFIQNNNPKQEDIVNSIIKNNIAIFQPLIQDYYLCEKYLAFSYYINNEYKKVNDILEDCKKENLWDYDIYSWLKENNDHYNKRYITPAPYLFDRLFLRDLHNTKH